MQFTTTVLASILAATGALAAPAPVAGAKSMMAAGEWTIAGFTRTCNGDDTSCDYAFGVNLNDGSPVTDCKYTVTGAPASHAPTNSVACGPFQIGSSWSGQFGPDQGFTTLSVVMGTQIVYPAYTDAQLQNGVTVSPDQSYVPQNLP